MGPWAGPAGWVSVYCRGSLHKGPVADISNTFHDSQIANDAWAMENHQSEEAVTPERRRHLTEPWGASCCRRFRRPKRQAPNFEQVAACPPGRATVITTDPSDRRRPSSMKWSTLKSSRWDYSVKELRNNDFRSSFSVTNRLHETHGNIGNISRTP